MMRAWKASEFLIYFSFYSSNLSEYKIIFSVQTFLRGILGSVSYISLLLVLQIFGGKNLKGLIQTDT